MMGLREVRTELIECLKDGRYEHEPRDVLSEKNLLAVGDVTAAHVIRLLQRCKGEQYECSPHDADRETLVHVFQPEADGRCWYIKAYFLSEGAVFISVHLAEEQ